MNDLLSDVATSGLFLAETVDTADQLNVIHQDLNILIYLITIFIALCISAVISMAVYKTIKVCS